MTRILHPTLMKHLQGERKEERKEGKAKFKKKKEKKNLHTLGNKTHHGHTDRAQHYHICITPLHSDKIYTLF